MIKRPDNRLRDALAILLIVAVVFVTIALVLGLFIQSPAYESDTPPGVMPSSYTEVV